LQIPRVPAQPLCPSSTPTHLLSPLTCLTSPLLASYSSLMLTSKHTHTHTLIPRALRVHKPPWAYQHRPSNRLIPQLRPEAPLLAVWISLRFVSKHTHSPRAPGLGKMQTDTQKLVPGARAVNHSPTPAASAEPLTCLTHTSTPAAGNTCCFCPSGWKLKTPTHFSGRHRDPAASSSRHHRPRAPTPWSDSSS